MTKFKKFEGFVTKDKYDFGECDEFNFQIDENDLVVRALNLGSYKTLEKSIFKFENYSDNVIENLKKFSL